MAVIKPEVYSLMFYELFLPYNSISEKSHFVGQFVSKTDFYAIICIS